MRAKMFFGGSAILLAALMIPIGAAQSPSPNSSVSFQVDHQPKAPQSDSAAKVETRLVTLAVIAENSRGDTVRDLKPEEFEIFDRVMQKVARCSFVDKQPNASATKSANAEQLRPKGFYTNQAAFASLAMPPTVVLMDALNTNGANQAEARRHMIRLLKTLPLGTPVAVFLLGHSLRVAQTFTSDPAVLRAAVGKAGRPSTSLNSISENDFNRMSLVALEENSEQENYVSWQIAEYQKETYSDTMNFRAEMTISALTNIARYLSGYPGRKNLIWVSASFPISLNATPSVQKDIFGGARAYGEQVQDAADAMTDAQVAVYPMDARVAETKQLPPVNGSSTAAAILQGSLSGRLNTEEDMRMLSQGTMDELAEDTGGKTCKNTNDLSVCVERALKDSSSYYELAYNAHNVNWDGSFLHISVKTTRPGIKLRYRRIYFARDAEAHAERQPQPAEQHLKRACRDLLPSTAISLEAEIVPQGPGGGLTYLLSVPPGALSLTPPGMSDELSARTALCEYGAKGGWILFHMMKPQTVSEAVHQRWQAHGFQEYVVVPPMADTVWIRIAVLNTRTGLTGALDIPMREADLVKAAVPPEDLSAAFGSPKAGVSENPPSLLGYPVAFHSSSGGASALDWNGDRLSYHGDIGVGQTAPVYFHRALGTKFHCENGELIPRDGSDEKPNLHFSFGNPTGQTAMVDLTGSEPQYSGDLAVDSSAKPFFEALWYLCHCRAAPQDLADPPGN
jgi:VWFA-related protein